MDKTISALCLVAKNINVVGFETSQRLLISSKSLIEAKKKSDELDELKMFITDTVDIFQKYNFFDLPTLKSIQRQRKKVTKKLIKN